MHMCQTDWSKESGMAFWLIGRISNSHCSHLGTTPGFSTLGPIRAFHPSTVNELVRSYDASAAVLALSITPMVEACRMVKVLCLNGLHGTFGTPHYLKVTL